MRYNERLYNGSSYNLTNYSATLSETLTETDVLSKQASMKRVDSQGTADAISDAESLAAFLETVTIYQHARTPFAYNNGQYNTRMYNLRVDEDEILLMATKALADEMIPSDFIAPFVASKLLAETISETTSTIFTSSPFYQDIMLMSDFVRAEISNKAFQDIIRVNDWLQFKHTPFTEYWGD